MRIKINYIFILFLSLPFTLKAEEISRLEWNSNYPTVGLRRSTSELFYQAPNGTSLVSVSPRYRKQNTVGISFERGFEDEISIKFEVESSNSVSISGSGFIPVYRTHICYNLTATTPPPTKSVTLTPKLGWEFYVSSHWVMGPSLIFQKAKFVNLNEEARLMPGGFVEFRWDRLSLGASAVLENNNSNSISSYLSANATDNLTVKPIITAYPEERYLEAELQFRINL